MVRGNGNSLSRFAPSSALNLAPWGMPFRSTLIAQPVSMDNPCLAKLGLDKLFPGCCKWNFYTKKSRPQVFPQLPTAKTAPAGHIRIGDIRIRHFSK